MKFANSSYLGGTIFEADECDYQTAKNLGLKCICCGEAVFLRTGTTRILKNNNKEEKQPVRAAFVHYKDTELNSTCKERIRSKTTLNKIEKIKIEGRNQRLKLYNKHLWEIYSEQTQVRRETPKKGKKQFGIKNIKELADTFRDRWENKTYPDISNLIDKSLEYRMHDRGLFSERQEMNKILNLDASDRQALNDCHSEDEKYFRNRCNLELHKKIVTEIAFFLTTKTSKYFWINFVAANLYSTYQIMSKSKEGRELFTKDDRILYSNCCACIFTTHWIEIIDKKLSSKS